MASQASLDKMQLRQSYRNVWHTDLTSAIKVDCPFCCFALWCGPCVSYMLRKRALYNDMSRYVCCAGYMPCSGKCGESKCPEMCLCTELSSHGELMVDEICAYGLLPPCGRVALCCLRHLTAENMQSHLLRHQTMEDLNLQTVGKELQALVFCCFGNSVASTRFLLQDEFNIQTTKCDNCIIGFMFCLQQVACIFSCIAMIVGSEELQEAAQILNCLSDLVYCTVCACMQTQHKVEMDKRDGMFGPQPVMAVPPAQHMSRFDQAVPPSAGYPPQPAYGQPAYGQPPPSAYGYPPPQQDPYAAAGYPPASYYPPPGGAYPPPGYPK